MIITYLIGDKVGGPRGGLIPKLRFDHPCGVRRLLRPAVIVSGLSIAAYVTRLTVSLPPLQGHELFQRGAPVLWAHTSAVSLRHEATRERQWHGQDLIFSMDKLLLGGFDSCEHSHPCLSDVMNSNRNVLQI